MTVMGMFFLLVSVAVKGEPWAIGLSVALASVVLLVLVHSAAFFVAWVMSEVFGLLMNRDVPESPFATHKPAPQIIPPTGPED